MFERFTRDARGAVEAAQREARAAGAGDVGPEHLLVAVAERCEPLLHGATAARLRALIAADEPDAEALARIGISLAEVRHAVEAGFGPGAWDELGAKQRVGFAPATKRALELALREALELNTRRIGPVELLLGLLREPNTAHLLLRRVLVDPEQVYRRTRSRLESLADMATR
jgi:ATP-dependent Clp protease ATP-binding subunit ClpA